MVQSVLVTGASGFVGFNLVLRLAHDGYDVHALIRSNNDKLSKLNIKTIKGDLLDKKSLLNATKDIDIVFHCAALLGGFRRTLYELTKTNLEGTKNLIESCKANHIKKMIYISTVGVMGIVPSFSDENQPYSPVTNYEISKRLSEEYVLMSNFPVVVIRPVMVYGPHETTTKLKMFELIQNRKFKIIGNGCTLHSWVYIDNLVDGIILSCNLEKSIGHTYIIADERPYSIKEFVNEIADNLNVKRPGHIPYTIAYVVSMFMEYSGKVFNFNPPLTMERLFNLTTQKTFDISKARNELGYNPKISLSEGIKRTIGWYKKEGML